MLVKNVFIHPSFQSFLSQNSFRVALSGFRGTGLGVTYQSKIKKKKKKLKEVTVSRACKQRSYNGGHSGTEFLWRSLLLMRGYSDSTGEAAWVFSGMWHTGAPGAMRETWEGGCGWWWWQSNTAFWLFTPGCTQSPVSLYDWLICKQSVCTIQIIHCLIWWRRKRCIRLLAFWTVLHHFEQYPHRARH